MKKISAFIVALFLSTTLNAQESTTCKDFVTSTNSEPAKSFEHISTDSLSAEELKLYKICERKFRLSQNKKNEGSSKNNNHSHEHRGFYFATLFGFNYSSISSSYNDDDSREHGHSHYKAFSNPDIFFRVGRSFFNLLALHFTLGFSNYIASSNRELYDWQNTEKITNRIASIFSGAFGIGFTLYPFRNYNSILNGLFIGFSHMQDLFLVVQNNKIATDRNDFSITMWQLELGKDWWLSDLWSIGASICGGYGTKSPDNEDKVNAKRIQILLRLVYK